MTMLRWLFRLWQSRSKERAEVFYFNEYWHKIHPNSGLRYWHPKTWHEMSLKVKESGVYNVNG